MTEPRTGPDPEYRPSWIGLTIFVAALLILLFGVIIWYRLDGGGAERGSGREAALTSAADDHVDALIARSRELANQFASLIAKFPNLDQAPKDELSMLQNSMMDNAREQIRTIDQLEAIAPKTLSSAQAENLRQFLDPARRLRENMVDMIDTLKEKLVSPMPPARKPD